MSAKRQAMVVGDVVHIPLTQGKTAIVDLIDADLGELNWYAKQGHGTWYAMRLATKPHKVSLHRTVAERAGLDIDGREVDHEDRDGLNCRRANLRPASHAQNAWNTRARGNRTGAKGVTFHPRAGRYYVRIRKDGVQQYVGCFATVEDAAAAYRAASQEMHGSFSRTA